MPSLKSGDRLGRYEVLEPLGKGGMGEVYRAEDTKLGRQVALKVLPDLFAADPERLARFEREARAASALNHPNICTVHDIGEHEGQPYLIMELLEGQSLRERIDAGPCSSREIVEVGAAVADALAAAHAAGIVHRDIKPGNVHLTDRGETKVLDFGLARIEDSADGVGVDSAAPTLHSPDLTRPGTAMGTVSYMSPEQVLGNQVDDRTDIFSLGVMLYETATGNMPFAGKTSGAVFDQIIHSAPTSPVKLNPQVPRDLERIVNRCLDKAPDRRPPATELHEELVGIRREMDGEALGIGVQAKRLLRRPAIWLGAIAVVALVAVVVAAWSSHANKVRSAHEEALPELRDLATDVYTNWKAGWQIVREAEPYLKDNAEFQELKTTFAVPTPVRSEPPGAEVFYKPYAEADAPWQPLGTTPIEDAVLPHTYLRWKLEKPGYETVLDVAHTANLDLESGRMVPTERLWRLEPTGEHPEGMIPVPGSEEIPAFRVDRYEVSNKQFKEFVDVGGYENPEYWQHEFAHPDGSLDFRSAMALFVDETGQPGPSTWEAGDYPDGKGNHPVSGISWYEAAAYAEFVGKQLPTIEHWYRATGIFVEGAQWVFTGFLHPSSNFGGDGPVPVGASQGMTPLGAVDMAGNVREWCYNPAPAGRILRGGAWNDQTYMFSNITQADAFDRSSKNGFRCVLYGDRSQIPAELFEPLSLGDERDLLAEDPVSDEVYAAHKAVFDYDFSPLDARIEARHEDNEDWVREKVSYTAAYGDERIIAQLFLPRNATPPFQAVVYFPGSSATSGGNSDHVENRGEFQSNIAFLLKTGRAVLFPVYRGTLERRHDIPPSVHWSQEHSLEFTTFQANIIKDVQRSVDYLLSRPDIDAERIAFSGFSWGGQVANLALAVEDRFKAAVINVGGLSSYGRPRPEVDYLNYTPRIILPVLMLNGRYDLALRLESEVEPMFQLLGTSDEHKRLIVYETDHWIDRKEVIKETVAWLDTYLGPVH